LNVLAQLTRDRHDPGLVRMTVDAVATALTLEPPAVALYPPDDIAYLHGVDFLVA
jgi:hypothetical protein